MEENLKILSDKELARRLRANPESGGNAFKELYGRHSRRIYLYCRKALGEGPNADDVFQEIFIRFYNAAVKGYEMPSVQFYLLKIARNLCLNHKRDNRAMLVELEDFHIPDNDSALESEEVSKLVNTALDLIPEEHKEAFILQVYQGMTYAEIAELTDVPLTTVRNRVVRAKRKLREILLPYFESNRV